jgi:hypothetical protein
MIFRIKITLGLLLAFFLFLPVGSCEKTQPVRYDEISGKLIYQNKGTDSSDHLDSKGEKSYLVLIEDVSLTDPGTWISLFVFLWPIPFLIIKNKTIKTKWKKVIASIIEMLFTGFSIYFIYFIVFFFLYDPTVWGYLAASVISVYGLLHLFEIFLLFRRHQHINT